MSEAAQREPARRRGPSRRVIGLGLVLAIALAVVGVVGATQSRSTDQPKRVVQAKPLAGRPPVVAPAALGANPTLAQLRRAASRPAATTDDWLRLGAALLQRGQTQQAVQAFAAAGHVGGSDPRPSAALALALWNGRDAADTIAGLGRLLPGAKTKDQREFVGYHLALAQVWAGRLTDAEKTLRAVRDAAPESQYGVRADDLLYPSMRPGYPFYAPSFPMPAGTPAQLARAAAMHPVDARAQLAYAEILAAVGRRREAVDLLTRFLAFEPGSVEAQVARAVIGFSKDAPAKAFGTIGPLAAQNPTNPSPRFHLGVMLLWLRENAKALDAFQRVAREDPNTRLGRIAALIVRQGAAG